MLPPVLKSSYPPPKRPGGADLTEGPQRNCTMQERITILVNQRPFHVDKPQLTVEEIRALVSAPSDYEVWKVIKSPDPEGQLPVDDVQITGSVAVKNGDRFRVVPPGTFGAFVR